MSKKTVLISAAAGSFFPYLSRSLRNKYKLILTDTSDIINRLYPDDITIVVPPADESNFENRLEEIITKHKINFYIPTIDKEILKILKIADKLSGPAVICPNKEFVATALNKYQLMGVLSDLGISRVETYLAGNFESQIKYPVFMKPISNTGSRGARLIEDDSQFNSYFKLGKYLPEKVMVQEYLEGEEFTVSVAVNNLNRLMAIVPKKVILKKGITQHAVTQKNKIISEVCRRIVEEMRPCGPFNVQLIMKDKQVRIFEINPRFSTTSILTCEAGINEFEMCIENYGKRNINQTDNFKENIYLYRRWESLFYK